MAWFSFIYPEALWLLALLIPLWGIALLVPRRLSLLRFWGGLILRTLLLLLLVLLLAGTQLVQPVNAITTIFLLDSSDSVSPSAHGQAATFVQEALETMHEDDQAGIVIFGKDALVERPPRSGATRERLTSLPITSHTNIEQAIQLGLALFPAETQKRLVLLSDGGENSGYALTAARMAATHNIPIETVDLSDAANGSEALITSIALPNQAHEGQEVVLSVAVESSIAQDARLRIMAEEQIIAEQAVHLNQGQNAFQFTIPASGQGFRRYRAEIFPERDQRVQNNQAAALLHIKGEPRVLLVEGDEDESRNLHDALTAAQITADVVAPDAMPTDLAGLSAYDAVILVNVAARALPVQAMATLPAYVRDLGHGLIMIGGTDSYGVGGYGRTPIEEALPVYMDVRNREERPNLALAFVVDKSGSMDSCHCSGPEQTTEILPEGERKVDIAKEAIIQASALLGPQDMLGIVAFDRTASRPFPMTRAPDAVAVTEAIAPMEPRGSTNIALGLHEARTMLARTDARIKHVILLTDGWGHGVSNYTIAQKMKDEEGITLSVVAAGSGSSYDLEQLAYAGGGRYYPVEHMREVPQIFLQETIMAAGHYVVEGTFTPMLGSDSSMLQGIERFPTLYGYNGSTIKETARTALYAERNAPLLAGWNYGLGRSIAWTSDMKGKWGRDLVTWEEYPHVASQLVAWVLPTDSGETLTADIRAEGTETILMVQARDTAGAPRDDLRINATLVESEPDGDDPAPPPQELTLEHIASGQYRASIPSPRPGTYLLHLSGWQDNRVVMQETAGLVVPYSPEYHPDQSNPALLDNLRQLTSGRTLSEPAQAFDHNLSNVARAHEITAPLLLLALLLLPLDIAARRFLFHRHDLKPTLHHLHQRVRRLHAHSRDDTAPAASESAQSLLPTLERLRQAKQRAIPPRKSSAPPPDSRSATPPPPPPTPAPAPPRPDPSAQTESTLERLRQAKQRTRWNQPRPEEEEC